MLPFSDTTPPNRCWLVATLAFTSLMLLPAACGYGEEEEFLTETPAVEVTPSPEVTPTAEVTPSPEVTPTISETAASGAHRELETLNTEWANTSAKVTYDFTETGAWGITEQSSVTLYWRPPDWRIDLPPFDLLTGIRLQPTIIVAAGTAYICDTKGAENQCEPTSAERAAGYLSRFDGLYNLAGPDAFSQAIVRMTVDSDIDRWTEVIAGEEATCFSSGGPIEELIEESEWCFASDGVLLRFAGAHLTIEYPARFRLQATSIDREVSDADFEPPYPG